MKTNKLTREQWIALSSLLVTYGLVACAPNKKTEQPLAPSQPNEADAGSVEAPQISEDEITRQKWNDLERNLQIEFTSILKGETALEDESLMLEHEYSLSQDDLVSFDLISESFARRFIVRARPLGLERAAFFRSELSKKVHETMVVDKSIGAYSGVDGEKNQFFGALSSNLDIVLEEMRREHNGFLSNLWEDVSQKTGEGVKYVGEVTGATEALETLDKKGTSAIKPSFREIPEGDEARAREEHIVKGGIGLGAAGVAHLTQRKLVTNGGYRSIVSKADPAQLIRYLVESDPKVAASRIAWGKQLEELKALKTKLKALKYELAPYGFGNLRAEYMYEKGLAEAIDRLANLPNGDPMLEGQPPESYNRKGELQSIKAQAVRGKVLNLKWAMEQIDRAQANADSLKAAFDATSERVRATMEFDVQNGKFQVVKSGFQSREELIKALKKINYHEGQFGLVRTGFRFVLKVAAPVGAAFAAAELVPLALGHEIVWVPKDVSTALENAGN